MADSILLPSGRAALAACEHGLQPRQLDWALCMLVMLLLARFVHVASLGGYFTCYPGEHFGVSARVAQHGLFVLLLGTATGTLIGGPSGERIGCWRSDFPWSG